MTRVGGNERRISGATMGYGLWPVACVLRGARSHRRLSSHNVGRGAQGNKNGTSHLIWILNTTWRALSIES